MEIKVVDGKGTKDYIQFCNQIYQDNPYYRDNMSGLLKGILSGKAAICKSSRIIPVKVVEGNKILAVCIYGIVDRMQDTLQLTFFEALENQEEAVDCLINYGRSIAAAYGIKKILVGLNFHVNYGLGLLASGYDRPQTFGSAYNPSYYIKYFKRYADDEVKLMSYLTDMKDFDLNVEERMLNRILTRYRVRKANFNEIEREAEIYTNLNNLAFQNHEFYYERRIKEDLELFKEFKVLLREENLLIMEHNGTPVGFMLWYPDYNELLKPGESIGPMTVIKNRLFRHKIKKFKIVELGVIPKHQKNGAVLALFHYLSGLVKDRYQYCEAGWILEENMASRGLCFRWAHKEDKYYEVFWINL